MFPQIVWKYVPIHFKTKNVSMLRRSISFFFTKRKEKEMFIIERVTLNDYEAVKNFLWCWYYPFEPLFLAADIGRKINQTLSHLDDLSLSEGYSFMARHKCDGSLIGVVINRTSCPWDSDELNKFACNLRCFNTRAVLMFYAYLLSKPDVWTRYCTNKIFEIEKVAVHEDHGKKGIGKALIKASLDLGADCGYRTLRCVAKNYYTGKICENLKIKMILEYPYSTFLNQHGAPMFCPPPPHTMIKVFVDTPHLPKR